MVRSRSAAAAAEQVSALALPDGGTAELRGEALEVRDGEGRLVVRYVDGVAEISAPAGDLRLRAPAGRVVIEAALDVAFEAGRDVVSRAGRTIDLDANKIEVKTGDLDLTAQRSRAVLGNVALFAHAVATTAERIAVSAGAHELVAERVVTRARESFREIADLAEERVGRVRSVVRDLYALTSRRTVMRSSDDTSIDGSRIQLG